MRREPRAMLASDLAYPESPRWHDAWLWFSDAHSRRVLRVSGHGRVEQVLSPEDLQDIPSGLGWLPDGSLLVVAVQSRRIIRLAPGGRLSTYADLSGIATGNCNDMIVSANGIAYVGTMGGPDWQRGIPAEIVMVRDGVGEIAARDVLFPNGMALLDRETRLIVAESTAVPARLTAFWIGPDGSLTDRRIFAEIPGLWPDGICSDAADSVWVASVSTNEVVKVVEGGKLVERVSTGERAAFACALGGDDGGSLFICTGPRGLPPAERAAAKPGAIEVYRTEK